MGIGTELRDNLGFGRYVRESILPLVPPREPVPFRAFVGGAEEEMAFTEDLEADILGREGAAWSVTGPPGFGKTLLGRWLAARWGRRFLENPETAPAPVWIGPKEIEAIADIGKKDDGPRNAFLRQESILAVLGTLPAFRPWKGPLGDLAVGAVALPLVLLIDRDEDRAEQPISLHFPPRSVLRVLHLALEETLRPPTGGTARLAAWDRETRLLAAQRQRGPEGVRRVEALHASPAAPLASYPLFVGRLLDRPEAPAGELAEDGGAGAFLRWVHDLPGGSGEDFLRWCDDLARDPDLSPSLALQARKLHSRIAPGHDPEYRRVFLAAILRELVRARRERAAFRVRVYADDEMEVLARLLASGGNRVEVPSLQGTNREEASNRANLRWKLGSAIPPRELIAATRLRIPGYRFPHGMNGLALEDSDLAGIALGEPRIRYCSFQRCSFREADLEKAEVADSFFTSCGFDLADLTDCSFAKCSLDHLDLSAAAAGRATFDGSTLRHVTFGRPAAGDPIRFEKTFLRACDLRALDECGLFVEGCELTGCDLSDLSFPELSAQGASFHRCDLGGLRAPGAELAKADLAGCLAAGVCLEGADLRGAKLARVDFQPGPGSRSGHTERTSRDLPMYGSESGFYGDDSELAAWGDPEVVRTADLRRADLTGAVLDHTDLFRVDLRGARLDPAFRDAARRMGAFL